MLPLTREARDLQYILQAAGDSSTSPVHSNCDGRRCSLCADVKIKQGLVMKDTIHVMCTPELSSLISEGITSGGIW
jgi:ferredoxin